MKTSTKIQLVTAASAILLLNGCYRQEVQIFTVSVPQLRSESCGKLITDRLLQVEGVSSAEIDVENTQIHVEYLSTKIARKNIEFVIAGIGFDANDRAASQAARDALPEECR